MPRPAPPSARTVARLRLARAAACARTRRQSTRLARAPRPQPEPGSKKVRQGTVVSSKADKTITVQIEVVRRHPVYEKVVRRSTTIHAHDESNDANAGDTV